MTSYGRRHEGTGIRLDRGSTASTSWRVLWLLGIILVLALFVILHLTTGGLGHH